MQILANSNSLPNIMDKEHITSLLLGNDLRTIRQNRVVVNSIHDQRTFDELFSLVFHHERPLVMRAIDAVEKVTLKHPEFLATHKSQLLEVLNSADHKELKWHIAQLIPRTGLTVAELKDVWNKFAYWALNKTESKIVRVNAIQGLFDLSKVNRELEGDFEKIVSAVKHEMIPSIQARIRKLKSTKA